MSTVPEQHSDLERLKEILFEITECKDDSQQRGWAVHDDEKAISDLLEEMLQILVWKLADTVLLRWRPMRDKEAGHFLHVQNHDLLKFIIRQWYTFNKNFEYQMKSDI